VHAALEGVVNFGDGDEDDRDDERQRITWMLCRRNFSMPNRHAENIVTIPPRIRTVQSRPGRSD
jgi:hypothetical protein